MKTLILAMLALASTIGFSQHAHGGGNGDPPPPGTGLTLDLGPTTRYCGFIMIDKTGVWGFSGSAPMKIWIDRQEVINYAEINAGQHSIVIETAKSLTPFVLRWRHPDLKTEIIPKAVLYPKMASTVPGCQLP